MNMWQAQMQALSNVSPDDMLSMLEESDEKALIRQVQQSIDRGTAWHSETWGKLAAAYIGSGQCTERVVCQR